MYEAEVGSGIFRVRAFLGSHRSHLPRAEKVDMPQQKKKEIAAGALKFSWVGFGCWELDEFHGFGRGFGIYLVYSHLVH